MDGSGYSFEDLQVYRAARELRKKIYRIVKVLPSEEQFALASQMRRAALSVTNNIAEGHGRYHYQDHLHFLKQSRGSLEEIIDDLNVCEDEEYVSLDEVQCLKKESYAVLKLLNGYSAYLRKRKNEADGIHRRTSPSRQSPWEPL